MDLNQKNVKQLKHLIIFTVVAVIAGINYQNFFLMVRWILDLLSPFLIGLAIAFVLNLPMKKIEKYILPNRVSKLRRAVSLSLTLLCFATIVLIVIFIVVPEVFRTAWGLQESIPAFLLEAQQELKQLLYQYPELADYINSIEIDWKNVMEQVVGFLTSGAGSLLASTMNAAVSLIDGVVRLGISFMFALYILFQKETLHEQINHLIQAFIPRPIGEQLIDISALTVTVFSSFLAGQCLEALILGMMFFVTLTMLHLPYALLIAVLIAFTALIPVFGSFVGCAIGTFLMLISSPWHTLTFLAIFFLLQQIEGNLIYPHVVGNSVGLPSIWVLVAVTLGGSMMGVVGMLIFIPICSVIYTLVRREMHKRLNQNKRQRGGD